ncbi:translation factor (SUA5) [Aerococcus urinaehominis]|uniref:Translation factor (SUA5) n=1 Tax=Aerococcus urinaehominis TaxID=128944 RepID=A0A0X8FK40_9LACT|nr:Sua5/YciO/YrdC/YwlC family protein [Aerococcus urinaehominis]AMB98777.1 translation factor (SUA5) [Aerococcus urinaehominis]SDM13035.1 tRNA A37 threonylcarbamoyladenosine synthetase subunit TsaC/SUA5/YrdC [Aerococcus urinaehominis]
MTNVADKMVHWDGTPNQQAIDILLGEGGMIVSPTKVGYILGTSDKAGLERKFEVKHRKRNKPGVTLCGSMEQLKALAKMTPEIEAFYQQCWDEDILMGCILPWQEEAKAKYMPQDGTEELATDVRGTSCFVIKFGTPGEQIAAELWERDKKLMFASSANPSGKGNRGQVAYIGEEIEQEADLIIEADDYVAAQQPGKTVESRYEQGVMVAFVDDEKGELVPEQGDQRDVSPAPILIRKGIYNDRILAILSEHFNTWHHQHGHYY